MPINPNVFPTAAPAIELVPVFILNLRADGEPDEIYKIPAKDVAMNRGKVGAGEVKSVPNKLDLVFNGTNITGADELTFTLSTGVVRLDCKLYGKTVNGSGFHITYTGTLKLNEAAIKTFSKQNNLTDFTEIDLTTNVRIVLDAGADEKDLWVQNENFVGRGRYIRDDSGELYIQYYIHTIRLA